MPDYDGHADAKGIENLPECSIASRWSKMTQIGRVITYPEFWGGRFFFSISLIFSLSQALDLSVKQL